MFLVFPLNDKPNWRRPPLFTLLLILINCIIFFGPQRLDMQRATEATEYYAASRLPGLEFPAYLEAQKANQDAKGIKQAQQTEALLAKKRYGQVLDLMERDAAFMARLRSGTVLTPAHPDYALWRKQRTEYDQKRGERFTERWMSVPALLRPETAITSTFLHGSTSHLIGNMVFLFAFGYTVELTLGGAWFLLFYLLAGVSGDFADLAVRWGSTVGSLGASGAVSGLMAMYAALYGLRKIRFFYLLAFYFDYVRAPALILLPAWIANELLQYFFLPNSNVGYMAHAGGLLAGAVAIFTYKYFYPDTQVAQAQPVQADPFAVAHAQAKKLLEQLKIDDARAAFSQLAKQRPDRFDVVSSYVGLAKLNPASEDFHRSAKYAFALTAKDEASLQFMRETFTRYMQQAQPRPRISPVQMMHLGLRFARAGFHTEAGQLEKLITRIDPNQPDLGSLRLTLVDALLRDRKRAEAEALAEVIRRTAPSSSAAKMVDELLAAQR